MDKFLAPDPPPARPMPALISFADLSFIAPPAECGFEQGVPAKVERVEPPPEPEPTSSSFLEEELEWEPPRLGVPEEVEEEEGSDQSDDGPPPGLTGHASPTGPFLVAEEGGESVHPHYSAVGDAVQLQ